jgi:hypothetical protein
MADGCGYLTGQMIAIDGRHHLAAPSTIANRTELLDETWAGTRGVIRPASERDKVQRTTG